METKLSKENKNLLCCPKCKQPLVEQTDHFECTKCLSHYPVIDHVPILINESNSIFSLSDFIGRKDTYFNWSKSKFIKKYIAKFIPSLSKNIKAGKNYSR